MYRLLVAYRIFECIYSLNLVFFFKCVYIGVLVWSITQSHYIITMKFFCLTKASLYRFQVIVNVDCQHLSIIARMDHSEYLFKKKIDDQFKTYDVSLVHGSHLLTYFVCEKHVETMPHSRRFLKSQKQIHDPS